MKKRMINLLLLIFNICIVFLFSSCKTIYNNEIVTKKVDYVENITIYDLEDALVTAVEICDKTVVGIESKGIVNSSFGSGVIIKMVDNKTYYSYYVVTNYHVISYNDKINLTNLIYLAEVNEEIKAEVLTYDEAKDIAILMFNSSRLLSVAKTGDSTLLKKGKYVIAIGNPKELKTYYNSVTIGNISFVNRKADDGSNNINYYIQHTAPINSGNSGGGLFDIYGNLIGINTWKYVDKDIEGMGFAIPIHIIKTQFSEYFD